VIPSKKSNPITPYIPSGNPPQGGWPFVVAFEGAAFHGTSSAKYGSRVAQYVLPQDIAVIAISYDQLQWPSGYEVGILSVVKEVASSKRLNAQRMGCIGESAGAWIASTIGIRNPTGTADTSWNVKAVANYYGPTDLAGLYLEHQKNGTPFDHVIMEDLIDFVGTYDEQTYNAASPIFFVNAQTPPHFLAQGGRDRTVYDWQSNELKSALESNGVYVSQTIIQNCTHGFDPNGVAYIRSDWWCHKNFSDPAEVNLGDDMGLFFKQFL